MIKATGGRVSVMPLTGDTDEKGRPMEGSIYLGREVQHPMGVVVSVGADAPEGLEKGQKVLWARDLGAEFEHEGVTLSSLSTQSKCPHCKRRIASDAIFGIVEPGGE